MKRVEPFLDALLIDEGQDLPPAFYRLAMKALRPPHRLYWAYDEAQGIGNLIVPRAADVFGQSEDGQPVVDLAGNYPSGIQKAHNLNRCYRTPADVLRTAHAFNMGLLRAGGPLQGVTTQQEWALLGYEVQGEFFKRPSPRDKRSGCDAHPTRAATPMTTQHSQPRSGQTNHSKPSRANRRKKSSTTCARA